MAYIRYFYHTTDRHIEQFPQLRYLFQSLNRIRDLTRGRTQNQVIEIMTSVSTIFVVGFYLMMFGILLEGTPQMASEMLGEDQEDTEINVGLIFTASLALIMFGDFISGGGTLLKIISEIHKLTGIYIHTLLSDAMALAFYMILVGISITLFQKV